MSEFDRFGGEVLEDPNDHSSDYATPAPGPATRPRQALDRFGGQFLGDESTLPSDRFGGQVLDDRQTILDRTRAGVMSRVNPGDVQALAGTPTPRAADSMVVDGVAGAGAYQYSNPNAQQPAGPLVSPGSMSALRDEQRMASTRPAMPPPVQSSVYPSFSPELSAKTPEEYAAVTWPGRTPPETQGQLAFVARKLFDRARAASPDDGSALASTERTMRNLGWLPPQVRAADLLGIGQQTPAQVAQAGVGQMGQAENFITGMGRVLPQQAADVASLVAPRSNYARNLREDVATDYAYDPSSAGGIAGQAAGNVAELMALGGAGRVAGFAKAAEYGAPPIFAASGAGGVRGEIDDRRQAGQRISGGAEAMGAVGTGLVQGLANYVGVSRAAAIADRIGEAAGPQVIRLVRARDAGGLGIILRAALNEAGVQGADGMAQQLATNAIAGQTFDPQRDVMQGVPEAGAAQAITGLGYGTVKGVGQFADRVNFLNRARQMAADGRSYVDPAGGQAQPPQEAPRSPMLIEQDGSPVAPDAAPVDSPPTPPVQPRPRAPRPAPTVQPAEAMSPVDDLLARRPVQPPQVSAELPAAPPARQRPPGSTVAQEPPAEAPRGIYDVIEGMGGQQEQPGAMTPAAVGDVGAGIREALYDGLWSKVEAGETDEAGQPSTILQAAKAVRDAGGMQTRDELVSMAHEIADAKSSGVKGKVFQARVRGIVEKYTPERKEVSDGQERQGQGRQEVLTPPPAAAGSSDQPAAPATSSKWTAERVAKIAGAHAFSESIKPLAERATEKLRQLDQFIIDRGHKPDDQASFKDIVKRKGDAESERAQQHQGMITGVLARLANQQQAIDKGYKRADPARRDGTVLELQTLLDYPAGSNAMEARETPLRVQPGDLHGIPDARRQEVSADMLSDLAEGTQLDGYTKGKSGNWVKETGSGKGKTRSIISSLELSKRLFKHTPGEDSPPAQGREAGVLDVIKASPNGIVFHSEEMNRAAHREMMAGAPIGYREEGGEDGDRGWYLKGAAPTPPGPPTEAGQSPIEHMEKLVAEVKAATAELREHAATITEARSHDAGEPVRRDDAADEQRGGGGDDLPAENKGGGRVPAADGDAGAGDAVPARQPERVRRRGDGERPERGGGEGLEHADDAPPVKADGGDAPGRGGEGVPGGDLAADEPARPDVVHRDALREPGRRADDRSLSPDARNHQISPDEAVAPKGDVAKITANVAAVKLAKKLAAEGRNATPEEKSTLAKFVGWGGLKELFNDSQAERTGFHRDENWHKKWGKWHAEVKKLLTPDEWRAASQSTLNAHYTTPKIIGAIWRAVQRLGFEGGRVLEPAAGIGHFLGLTPKELLGKVDSSAVELDAVSGQILSKLYPQSKVQVTGFEDAKLPRNYYDLAISNVPFHEVPPSDLSHKVSNLHNYFFARAFDLVRPGGIVAFITSNSTMDNNPKDRSYLAARADLVGAIRLPNDAFKENAGTEVVTDILFFRKPDGSGFRGEPWALTKDIEVGGGSTQRVNEYFIAHPGMVLGEHSAGRTMYRENSYTVKPRRGEIGPSLEAAIAQLPANVMGGQRSAEPAAAEHGLAARGQKEDSYSLKGDQVVQARDAELVTPEWAKPGFKNRMPLEKRVAAARSFIGLRDAAVQQTRLESDPSASDQKIEANRKRLRALYDRHVKDWGNTAGDKLRFLSEDPEYFLVSALENMDRVERDGKFVTVYGPADILARRVIVPRTEPTSAGTAPEAATISMQYRGRIDPDYVAKLTGLTRDQAVEQLVQSGQAFEDPKSGELASKERYLAGNVRRKLEEATAAAKTDDRYKPNVAALEKVQPARVGLDNIRFKIGTSFVPERVYTDWLNTLLDRATVRYNEATDTWSVSAYGANRDAETAVWGTPDVPASKLVEQALNLKRPTVRRTVYDGDGKKSEVVDQAATDAALEKQAKLRESFEKYARGTPEAMKSVEDAFNDRLNNFAIPTYDGSHIILPGMASVYKGKPLTLRPRQRDSIHRVISEGFGMLAHAVGAGKTIAQIASAMEMRRLGLAKKPMIVVDKKTIGQFATAFRQLYPAARILVADADTFDAKNRRRFMSRISTGDWDAVIMAQSQFNLMPSDPHTIRDYMNRQVDELREVLEQHKKEEGRGAPRVRELETAIKSREKRTKDVLAKMGDRQDDAVYFEQTGVDALFIDEAHAYKKVPFSTKMERVKGLDIDESQRAMILHAKIQHVQARNNGRNVVLATGTPVTNTLTEAWNMTRLVAPHLLKEFGVETFDQFASTFASVEPHTEMDVAGNWVTVNRFGKFVNGPTLVQLIRNAWDVVMGDDVKGVNLPKVRGDKPQVVAIEQSQPASVISADLRAIYKKFQGLQPKERREVSWVPIVTMGLGMSAATDPRLINPNLPDDPNSVVNNAVRNILRIHRETAGDRSTQIVFLDRFNVANTDKLNEFYGEPIGGANATEADRAKFNLYDDIRDKLVAAGVKASEIAIANEATSDQATLRMQTDMQQGKLRILIGSTAKIGQGINVQDKLIAAHHIDPPRNMTPAEYIQRNGRIIRDGNENGTVDIVQYGMKKTLAAGIWQRLETKAKFIIQVLQGRGIGVEFDDPTDGVQMSLAEQSAALTGDTRVLRKVELEAQVRDLQRSRSAHNDSMANVRAKIDDNKSRARWNREQGLPRVKASNEALEKAFDPKGMELVMDGGKGAANTEESIQRIIDRGKEQAVQQDADPSSVAAPKLEGKLNGVPFTLRYTLLKDRTDPARPLISAAPLWTFYTPGEEMMALGESRAATVQGAIDAIARFVNTRGDRVANIEADTARLEKSTAALSPELANKWGKDAELDAKQQELAKITRDLQSVEEKGADDFAKGDEPPEDEEGGEGGGGEEGGDGPDRPRMPPRRGMAYVPGEEVAKAIKAVAGTQDDADKVVGNILSSVVSWLGAPFRKALESDDPNWLGAVTRAVGSQLVPQHLAPVDFMAAKYETKNRMQYGRTLAKEYVTLLTKGGRGKLTGFVVPADMATPGNRRKMYDVLTGQADASTLPGPLRDLAENMRDTIDRYGQTAVDEGLMKQETYDKRAGSYLPRLYREKELEKVGLRGMGRLLKMNFERFKFRKSDSFWIEGPGGKPVSAPDGTPSFESADARDDFYDKLLDQQLLKIANNRLPKGQRLTLKDLNARTGTAEEPSTQDKLVDSIRAELRRRYEKRNPLSMETLREMGLIEEAAYPFAKALVQLNNDIHLRRMFDLVDGNQAWVSEEETPGFVKMDDNPRYGPLAGKWVQQDVHREITEMTEMPHVLLRAYDGMMTAWKMGKTVLNMATWTRNALSNILYFAPLASASPMNPFNLPYYRDAVKVLGGKMGTETMRELHRTGVLSGDYVTADLQQLLIDPRDIREDEDSWMHRLVNPFRITAATLAHGYRLIDDVFKVAAYLKQRRAGATEGEAAEHTNTWYPNYNYVPKTTLLQGVKRLLMPFLSFFYEAARIAGNALTKKPVTAAAMLLLPMLATEASLVILGLGDDDRKRVRGRMRGHGALGVLLPFRNSNGDLIQADLSSVMPFSDVLGLRSVPTDDPLWQRVAAWMFTSSPATAAAYGLATNRNPASGKRLRQTGMSGWETLQELTDFVGNIAAPPLTPKLGTSYDRLTGESYRPGSLQPQDKTADALRALGGLDVSSAQPSVGEARKRYLKSKGREPMDMGGSDSTPVARAKRSLYNALVNNDRARFDEEAGKIVTLGSPDPRTEKGLLQLVRQHNPLGNDVPAKEHDDLLATLSPEERRMADRSEAKYGDVRRRALEWVGADASDADFEENRVRHAELESRAKGGLPMDPAQRAELRDLRKYGVTLKDSVTKAADDMTRDVYAARSNLEDDHGRNPRITKAAEQIEEVRGMVKHGRLTPEAGERRIRAMWSMAGFK